MKGKVTTVILGTYIKIVPRRIHGRKYKKKAFPKNRGSMKACETETATGRTEPKGLKEKLMLQIGRIQAVNKSCSISTEVAEQSGAEVLQRYRCLIYRPRMQKKIKNPGKRVHLAARCTPAHLLCKDRKLAVQKHFRIESSKVSGILAARIDVTILTGSAARAAPRGRDSRALCPPHTIANPAVAQPSFCKS